MPSAPSCVLLLLAAAALLACLSAPDAARAQTLDAAPCAEVPGLDPLLQPGVVLLLGEMHGTIESPRFVANALCRALAMGRAVTVALELPHNEMARVRAYLDAEDGAEQRLLQAPSWQRAYQDGRNSEAMLDLLRRIGAHRTEEAPVRVVLIDEPTAGGKRDSVMSARLAQAVATSPDDLFLVLTGNVHNRLVRGTRWNEAYEPMGYLLRHQLPDRKLYALNVAHTGGAAWVCFGSEPADCGTQKIGPAQAEVEAPRVVLDADLEAYSGWYAVGPLTASPPAIRAGE